MFSGLSPPRLTVVCRNPATQCGWRNYRMQGWGGEIEVRERQILLRKIAAKL